MWWLPVFVIRHQLRVIGHFVRDKQRQAGGVCRQVQQADTVKGAATQLRQVMAGRFGERQFALILRIGRQRGGEGFAQ
ncbi:hypothetical protein D3C71_2031850 [compost metagenome]